MSDHHFHHRITEAARRAAREAHEQEETLINRWLKFARDLFSTDSDRDNDSDPTCSAA